MENTERESVKIDIELEGITEQIEKIEKLNHCLKETIQLVQELSEKLT